MQKSLDNVIGENQSAAIKNRKILHTLSTIRDIIDISRTFSITYLDFLKTFDRRILSFLFCKSSDMETLFIHMIKVAYTNIQSKNKINGLISDLITLMRGVRQGCPVSILLYIIAAEVLANFIDTNKRIKGIHIANFVDNTIIFLQDITCLDRIQKILKLYEDAFNSKIKFSKTQALSAGAYKNRIDGPGQMEWSQFFIKKLGVNFGYAILDNSNWNKISEGIIKKIHI